MLNPLHWHRDLSISVRRPAQAGRRTVAVTARTAGRRAGRAVIGRPPAVNRRARRIDMGDATMRGRCGRIANDAKNKCRRKHESCRVPHLQALITGWGGRIRTSEWRNQNPLPYHLATPQKHGEFASLEPDSFRIIMLQIPWICRIFWANRIHFAGKCFSQPPRRDHNGGTTADQCRARPSAAPSP